MSAHFVYMYRHKNGIPFYVGYGMDPKRAASHAEGSHNKALEMLLKNDKYLLEIAGPFGDEATGRAVETALISSYRLTLVNIHRGELRHRFRPYGVPYKFADRLSEPSLDIKAIKKKSGGPVLAVYVNSKDFTDGRKGFDPSAPPTDDQIVARMEGKWRLTASIKRWKVDPTLMPKLLIGFSGGQTRRFVIGAVPIQPLPAEEWKWTKNRRVVPIERSTAKTLDAFSLRGRLADITFRRDGLRKD